jgi:hypothetical protein
MRILLSYNILRSVTGQNQKKRKEKGDKPKKA